MAMREPMMAKQGSKLATLECKVANVCSNIANLEFKMVKMGFKRTIFWFTMAILRVQNG